MRRPTARRVAHLAAAAGTLVLALVLLALSPRGVVLDNGWFTPVLAFEFATNPADVAFMTEPVRLALDRGQRVDMLFPFFYGGLLVTSAMTRTGWAARVGRVLGAVAVPLDLIENLVMAGVSRQVASGGDVAGALAWLPAATWAKWLAIAGALFGLALRTTVGG